MGEIALSILPWPEGSTVVLQEKGKNDSKYTHTLTYGFTFWPVTDTVFICTFCDTVFICTFWFLSLILGIYNSAQESLIRISIL